LKPIKENAIIGSWIRKGVLKMSINLGALIIFLLASWKAIDILWWALSADWKAILNDWFD